MGRLLLQSEHLCRFHQELCCNLCKGKAEKREPPNDGSSHAKRTGTRITGRSSVCPETRQGATTQTTYTKAPSVKLPKLHFEMTPQQLRKFRIDWEAFTRIANMPISQTIIQLYSCADESVQNPIINTNPKFFTTDPDKLLEMIEALITQRLLPGPF